MAKSDDVRNLLMQTADKLFFERGYDDVGVADICKAAHSNTASVNFFYYFEKKETVVKRLVESQVVRMAEHLTDTIARMDVPATEKMSFLMQTLVSKNSIGPRAMAYFKASGIPDWFDYYTHTLKDKYIFPIINDVVKQIEKTHPERNKPQII